MRQGVCVKAKNDRPIMKCFPDGNGHVLFWCPYCAKWHHNGHTPDITARGRSHRVMGEHDCTGKFPRGYDLRMMTKAEIKRICAALDLI